MQSSPASLHFLSLMSKYSPQHPVLRHPHSVEVSCEYIEQAVADSRQGVILQLGICSRG